MGRRHPVTVDLPGGESEPPAWGRWFRTIDAEVGRGKVLMEAPGERPLMVLDYAGKGRVAQILSDHIWLWSRGYEGGGPQAELLRRLAHWLMKEPDLEEEQLTASVQRDMLTIERRTMEDATPPAIVTAPSGTITEIALDETAPGQFATTVPVRELGLYRVSQGELDVVAAAGPPNPREFADVRATDKPMRPIARATGGGIWWVGENAAATPGIRSVRASHLAAGDNWLGLRRNEKYLVHAVRQTPLLVGPLALALILGALALAWWREGR